MIELQTGDLLVKKHSEEQFCLVIGNSVDERVDIIYVRKTEKSKLKQPSSLKTWQQFGWTLI